MNETNLKSIVTTPGGYIRSQQNFSLSFMTDHSGEVFPLENQVSISGKNFCLGNNYSFKPINAEIYSVYPVRFTLFSVDLGLDKLIERGRWCGRMNNFPLQVEYEWSPLELLHMHAEFLTPDSGRALLILNGLLRRPVQ